MTNEQIEQWAREAKRYRYIRDAIKRKDVPQTQALLWNAGSRKQFDDAVDAAIRAAVEE